MKASLRSSRKKNQCSQSRWLAPRRPSPSQSPKTPTINRNDVCELTHLKRKTEKGDEAEGQGEEKRRPKTLERRKRKTPNEGEIERGLLLEWPPKTTPTASREPEEPEGCSERESLWKKKSACRPREEAKKLALLVSLDALSRSLSLKEAKK